MNKRGLKKPKGNLKLAGIFFAAVFVIFFISLLFKFLFVVRQSIYDSSQNFILEVSDEKNKEILLFLPNHSISTLKIEGDTSNINVNKLVGIPQEGYLTTGSLEDSASAIISKSILNYRNIKTNLTILDLLRLFLVSATVSQNQVQTKSVSINLDISEIDKTLSRFFVEEAIEKENNAIEIVNGTDVLGLGNRLARLVVNMGGNVVSVRTADKQTAVSGILYAGEKDYTVSRLSKVLGFKVEKTTYKTLADITIVIGLDTLSSLQESRPSDK